MSSDSVPDGGFSEDLMEHPEENRPLRIAKTPMRPFERYAAIRGLAAFIADLIVTYDDTVSCRTGKPWYEIAQEALDVHREGR